MDKWVMGEWRTNGRGGRPESFLVINQVESYLSSSKDFIHIYTTNHNIVYVPVFPAFSFHLQLNHPPRWRSFWIVVVSLIGAPRLHKLVKLDSKFKLEMSINPLLFSLHTGCDERENGDKSGQVSTLFKPLHHSSFVDHTWFGADGRCDVS